MDQNTPANAVPPISPPPIPPPLASAPLRPKERKPRGWMILALILLVLLFLSVMAFMGDFAMQLVPGAGVPAGEAGPRLEEVLLQNNHASQKIAVIPVEGIIMSQSLDGGAYGIAEVIRAQLRRAGIDSRVKAVILRVDSPGGEVLASDEIYQEVLTFQRKTGKPVIAAMGSLAASGGYYVSAPCRWIVANEMTLTGSIGVIMSSYNYHGLMEKVGVTPMTFKSGRFKDMMSGSRDPSQIPPEERKMVQELVDEVFQKFKTIVQEGRAQAWEWNNKNPSGEKGRRLAENWEALADGRVISGTQAFENGFVDELGNFDVAVERAKTLAQLRSANVVLYRQHYDFADFLRVFGKSDQGIKVDIGLSLPKLKAGQAYFLSPTLFQ